MPGSIAFTQRKKVRKKNDSKNDVGNVIDRNEEEAKIFMKVNSSYIYVLTCLDSEVESATEKPSNDEQDIPPIHVSPPRPGKYALCF